MFSRAVGRRHGCCSGTESSPSLSTAIRNPHVQKSHTLASRLSTQPHHPKFHWSSGLIVRYTSSRSRGLGCTPTLTSRKIYTVSAQERSFSATPSAMTATKIDGNAIAKEIREKIHAEIQATQKINPRYKPSLKIVQGMTCASCDLV